MSADNTGTALFNCLDNLDRQLHRVKQVGLKLWTLAIRSRFKQYIQSEEQCKTEAAKALMQAEYSISQGDTAKALESIGIAKGLLSVFLLCLASYTIISIHTDVERRRPSGRIVRKRLDMFHEVDEAMPELEWEVTA